jgi:hypothetical protein
MEIPGECRAGECMTQEQPTVRSKWPRRLRVGALILIALMLVAMPIGWLLSIIPSDRVDPPPRQPQPSRSFDVIPPEARIPWTRDVNEPSPARLTAAPAPWKRSLQEPSTNVNIALASTAWKHRITRPKPADLTPASLPWPVSAK